MEEPVVTLKQLLAVVVVVAAEPPAAVVGLVAVVMDLRKRHSHQDRRQSYDA